MPRQLHCLNGGFAQIVDGLQICRCLDEFTGSFCQHRSFSNLSISAPSQFASYSAFVALAALVLLVTMLSTHRHLRRKKQPHFETQFNL
ncbi:Oidioi.mRNA.OKI2018_I69.chr2.g5697.t1.cds [Oikopleura dioica]|uniref:Oidioi.mRNA.OKI2018_I69.chr2.g5697.t1.cds n=1 Tax=Oikopleura dioica TaxID=34765 RepID=A0ABN7T1M8_OIKDI|nr:Oidioi.mRNA.OKI2018_I69.chr2.g5697.t1.cds [Oikopleura dioica]